MSKRKMKNTTSFRFVHRAADDSTPRGLDIVTKDIKRLSMCTSMRSQAKPDSSVPPADLFSSLVSYRRNCRGSGRTYLHCIDGRPACLRQCLWSLWHTDVSKYATFGIPKSSSLLRGSSGRFIWANDRNYHGLLSDAASSPTETGPRGGRTGSTSARVSTSTIEISAVGGP